MQHRLLLLLGSLLFCCSLQAQEMATVNNFSLRGADGKMFSTSGFPNVKGFIVVFTCNHCPFAKLYSGRYNQLNKKYAPLGVPLIAINSMDTIAYDEESMELMQKKAKSSSFSFPYLQDGTQSVGKLFGAEHTPQAFVIWRSEDVWQIKYKGAVDDNGEHPESAVPFVANAVDELLSNKAVTNPSTPSFGCRIYYRADEK